MLRHGDVGHHLVPFPGVHCTLEHLERARLLTASKHMHRVPLDQDSVGGVKEQNVRCRCSGAASILQFCTNQVISKVRTHCLLPACERQSRMTGGCAQGGAQ